MHLSNPGDQRGMLPLQELVCVRIFGIHALATQANSDKRIPIQLVSHRILSADVSSNIDVCVLFTNPHLQIKATGGFIFSFYFYIIVPSYGWRVYDIVTVLKLSWCISTPCLEGGLSGALSCHIHFCHSRRKKNYT